MQRRGFLQSLLALAGTSGVVSSVHALPLNKSVIVQSSPIAGFQYHEGEDIWPHLKMGDGLVLVREADNRYDAQAVRIDWHGYKLGYVPRRDNTAVSQMLDRGLNLQARISRLRYDDNPWERIEVLIFVQG